jgi:hypothetical protein
VYGCSCTGAPGTVLPLGLREGVDLRVEESFSRVRRLKDADFGVRRLRVDGLSGVSKGDEVSMLIGVAVRLFVAKS